MSSSSGVSRDLARGVARDLAAFIAPRPTPSHYEPAITALPGDASTRRYFRLRAAGGGESFGAPVHRPSLILMALADPDPFKAAEEIEAPDADITELPFVNVHRYLERHGVAVPAIYYYNVEAGRLYIEDCGDAVLDGVLAAADETQRAAIYRRAVETLVHMQAEAARHPDTQCLGFRRTFDESLLFWELDHFREYGVEAVRGAPLPDDDRAELDHAFRRLAATVAAAPREFAHRDYHTRNLLLQDERLRVIDFQDALFATPAYDLASLLRDAYVTVRPDEFDTLTELFIAERARHALDTPPPADFRRLLLLQGLQRNLKVVGRFHYIDIVKRNPAFLDYIPRVVSYIAWALDALPGEADLRRAVARYYPEVG